MLSMFASSLFKHVQVQTMREVIVYFPLVIYQEILRELLLRPSTDRSSTYHSNIPNKSFFSTRNTVSGFTKKKLFDFFCLSDQPFYFSVSSFHQSSYFFMCSNLCHPTEDDEIYTPTHNALSGQTVSSMFKLNDIDNQGKLNGL